jgi:hypothetical protein
VSVLVSVSRGASLGLSVAHVGVGIGPVGVSRFTRFTKKGLQSRSATASLLITQLVNPCWGFLFIYVGLGIVEISY